MLEISTNDVKIANDPKEQEGLSSINKLEQYIQFPVIYAEEIDKEIESISREFFQLKKEEKKRLQRFPKRIIESIIGHQSLQLESEDSLLEFVNELYAKDREMVDLYSYVDFINVSKNEMRKYVELFEKDDLTGGLWMRLCERLCEEDEIDLSKRYQNGSKSVRNKTDIWMEIMYVGQEFDGLLNFLRNKASIQDEINISCSSLSHGVLETIYQFEGKESSCWTNNSPNSWVCFEFKRHEIIPKHYTIRTYRYGVNGTHLKSWILEGSRDHNSWTILDEENDCSYLNGANFIHTFGIQNESNKSFKYLRIRQTGAAWNNTHYFRINCIEFYGQLI